MKRTPILFVLLLLAELAAGTLILISLLRLAPKPPPLVAPAGIATPQAPSRPSVAVILCYHALSPKPATPYVSSIKDFTAQMEWLAMQHYQVVPLFRLAGYFENKQALPESLVAITFDDGYESVYTEAWPVLKRMGYPFTIFIYPSFIGKGRGSLSWKQIGEMAAAGVEVGSHSMTHPVLTHRESKSDKAYRQWLAMELKGSKDTLEARLKKPVPYLAYPYGAFDRTVEDAAKDAGYACCFLVDAGVNDALTSPYLLDRVIISRTFPLPLFKSVLSNLSVELDSIRPFPGEEVRTSRNLDISARIRNLGGFDPASVRITVTKGKGSGSLDTARSLARFALDQPLKKGFHEAAIHAKNKHGQRCVGCWMFLVRE